MAPPTKKTKTKNDRNLELEVRLSKPSATTTTKKKKTENGQNPKKNFSDLHADLIANVIEGLSSIDRMRFGATSKKHLSLFTATEGGGDDDRRHRYVFRAIDKLPWIAVSDFARLKYDLFDPLPHHGRPHYATYDIQNPSKQDGLATLIGTKKGWLLCLWPKQPQKKGDGLSASFSFFSPFNKRVIELPDLESCSLGGHKIGLGPSNHQATFSSDDPTSPNCVYFVLSEHSHTRGKFIISTLQRGRKIPPKWETKVVFDQSITSVLSVVYHDGCFYCLFAHSQLAAYNVMDQSWVLIIPTLSILIWNFDSARVTSSLLVCEGELLFAAVVFQVGHEYDFTMGMLSCALYEFDSYLRVWVKRRSLGNRALFLGCGYSFTVLVPPGSDDIGDRMYFHNPGYGKLGKVIYYSFKDGKCHAPEQGSYWSSKVIWNSGKPLWIEPVSPSEPA